MTLGGIPRDLKTKSAIDGNPIDGGFNERCKELRGYCFFSAG
jgi:hypothetical protein